MPPKSEMAAFPGQDPWQAWREQDRGGLKEVHVAFQCSELAFQWRCPPNFLDLDYSFKGCKRGKGVGRGPKTWKNIGALFLAITIVNIWWIDIQSLF